MGKRGKRSNATGRTKGEARHFRWYRYFTECPAYRDLKPLARACLVEFYALHNGGNNGDLHPGVRWMAERLNVTANTACKAISALEAHGFIRATERGSFHQKHRKATRWVLTEYEFAGQLPTKDFMKWQNIPKKQKSVANFNADGIKNYEAPEAEMGNQQW